MIPESKHLLKNFKISGASECIDFLNNFAGIPEIPEELELLCAISTPIHLNANKLSSFLYFRIKNLPV